MASVCLGGEAGLTESEVVPERARRCAFGSQEPRYGVSCDGTADTNGAGAPIQLTPPPANPCQVTRRLPRRALPVSAALCTRAPLQYRINAAPFHLVTLGRRRLDRCSAEICSALQMRAPGVKISNAVGLLFCTLLSN